MYRSMLLIVVALVALLVVGCAPQAAGSPGDPTPLVITPDAGASPVATPNAGEEPVETPAAGASGEVAPELTNQAAAWLADEVGVSAADLSLVAAEAVEWTDSCFGLGGPAESCLAAMTPGWRLSFEAGGQQYEVRTDQAGSNFRLAPQGS